MKLAEVAEIRPLITGKMTASLLLEALRLNHIPLDVRQVILWDLERLSRQHAIELGWNPDTTLVLYALPPDKKPDDSQTEDQHSPTEELTLLNHTRCSCMFFQNMTLEKLAKLINQIDNMKAFL